MATRFRIRPRSGLLADMTTRLPEQDVPPIPRTTVALLGTLGELHAEGLRYDLARLRSLVETLEPDFLGVQAEPVAWDSDDPGDQLLEVRAALVPSARLTDTVVVPLGAPTPNELASPETGELADLRAGVIRAADALIAALGRLVDSPAGVSRGTYVHLCGFICHVEAAAAGDAGRRAWHATNERILDRLLEAIRRDPGRRVLVAVQCRRIHFLEARLATLPEVELVPFERLAKGDRLPGSTPA